MRPNTLLLFSLLLSLSAPAVVRAGSFVTFESGQARPLALSPDGTRLFAVNTPDAHLEVFAVGAGGLIHTASVPVGLEPVAVAARTDDEVWVVNHLSDSVSIVDVGAIPPRVVRTLLVGDEAGDIVFAGPGSNRAFITTAHRGQNSPVDPQLTTPGVGRADVWVFDALDLGSSLGGTPLTIVTLFGDTPRALAVAPGGGQVYAAIFRSGNRTTTVHEGLVCDGGAGASPCAGSSATLPGGLPAPNTNFEGIPGPETGLIVRFNPVSGDWEDSLARVWNDAVRFTLPDKDVFVIDALADPPVETGSFTGVGGVLFSMAVNPVSGALYVSNTEAHNEVRFEGPGVFGGSTTRGHLHEARITVLDGAGVSPRHLNKHIDYGTVPSPAGVLEKSLSTPLGLAVTGDGQTLYVAAFGSSEIGVFATARLEDDSFVPDAADHIAVTGGGPTGLVLDEPRGQLYVLTRFDNAVSVIDTATRAETAYVPLYNPEPPAVVNGRSFLYDATRTSSNGEASCASCHVFADLDALAWDLGNPDGTVLANPNPFRFGGPDTDGFHPMKGPMTTQSLRGLANHGPMHWRGDRTGGNDPGGDPLSEDQAFKKFNVAFAGLLGRGGPLADAEMQAFTDFILEVTYPPNPMRALDGSLTPDEQAGRDIFTGPLTFLGQHRCQDCHVFDSDRGLFGSDGFSESTGPQVFKIPHLRNLYQKVGMFGMPGVLGLRAPDEAPVGDQIRGFGFTHDGSVSTAFRFLGSLAFARNVDNPNGFPNGLPGETMRRQVEHFLLAIDSNLAPVVGQQTTLTSASVATVGARIDLLAGQAALGRCDLTVKGTIGGQQRGWYRTAAGVFQADRAVEPPATDGELRAQVAVPGQALTYTCVPPGSGQRAGIDRDEDGDLDRDELDQTADPANPRSRILRRPRLRIGKNQNPAGDETLTLSGQVGPGGLHLPIDPLANGFRVRISDVNGVTLASRVVPAGAAAAAEDPGWRMPRTGRYVFRDPGGTVAGGITRVEVAQRSVGAESLYRVKVKGRGNFHVDPATLPVRIAIALEGDDGCRHQPCAAAAFSPSAQPAPSCFLSSSGVVSCR